MNNTRNVSTSIEKHSKKGYNLEKFRKQNPDMKEPLNQWLAFLDMERGILLEMAMKENKKIEKAVKNYNKLAGDEEI